MRASSKASRAAMAISREGQGGLTLLEIMVALTIMTVGLLVLLAGFSQGGRARRSAELYTKGVMAAESIMDRFLDDGNVEEGSSEGVWEPDTSITWKIEVVPHPTEDEDEEPLLEVRLRASWPDGTVERFVDLATLVPLPEP